MIAAPLEEMTPAAIAASIQTAWAAYLTRSSRSALPHRTVYASAWRACVRRMVYEMAAPQNLPPFPAHVLARFRRGDDRERDLLADLSRMGRDSDPPFAIVGQQERFELKDRKGRIAISGKVDARIQINGRRPPLECKAWSPFVTDRIERFSDLFENPWTRSGAYQLLSYLFGAGEAFGFLLLDRSGLPKLIPVELDDENLERVEDFLTRAQRAIDGLEALDAGGDLPPFLENDPAECKRCPFYGGTCNPPLAAEGSVILTDPDLEAALARREELDAAATEYDRIDKRIKEQLRGVEHGIAGSFVINGKYSKSSRVELPADLKAKYTKTDPRGRFTLEITRLGGAVEEPKA
jgi:hypothetical protein